MSRLLRTMRALAQLLPAALITACSAPANRQDGDAEAVARASAGVDRSDSLHGAVAGPSGSTAGWATLGSSCATASRLPPPATRPIVTTGPGLHRSHQDGGFPELAEAVPGGFGGLFFEHDPYPLVPGEPPPETRRIVLLLTDTARRVEALEAVDSTIRRLVPQWSVTPRVELARWSVAELRAWDRYLVNRPGLREGLAWSSIDARKNRLVYAVWDVPGRARLEARLSDLSVPCELVWIELGTDTSGAGDMLKPVTPWAPRGFHFVRGCGVPPGEPPAGPRIYDLKLQRRFRGPDPRDQLTPLIERIGGRVVHRFNVDALRASLAAKQAGFLLRADSSNVAMAIEVLDPTNYNIAVYIHYPTLPDPEDFDRLEPYTVRRLSRRRGPYVQTVVPDSNIPRIQQLPGVAYVRVQLGGCGGAG